jgi:hypothetical protein
MFKSIDMSRIMEMIWARAGRPVFKLTLDKSQPDIGERILTGQLEITRELMGFGVVSVDCWCDGIGTKDDPSEDGGKKYCGCAVGEAAFLAACRARRELKTGGLEE